MDGLGIALNSIAFIPGIGDGEKAVSTIGFFMVKHAGDSKYLADLIKALSKCFLPYMPDYFYKPAYGALTNGQVDRLLYLGIDWNTIMRLGSEGKNINELARQSDRLLGLGIDSNIIKELITNKKCDLAETLYAFKRGEYVVWLEKGSDASGWTHIFNRHIKDYNGVDNEFAGAFGEQYRNADSIQNLIYDCVKYGKEDSMDSGVYYLKVNENKAVKTVVGSNGYIVSSRPVKLSEVPITL